MTPQQTGLTGASVSLSAWFVSEAATALPIVQFIAACLSIAVAGFTLWKFFRK